ncbi:hypothetical protein SEA_SIXAMA_19 [Gordonia phage Sixama]|uniref:Uncharacterized protein n=1 Tax=Gordonia phage Sixama TaxID=2653271 RepID=A0A5Q2F1Q6_9CAUD|nr:hypothetical protein PP302_gp019 [Gordonia phage Sixama]QGF20198.1 hypothetical protein SEA_SIXAMA_19 [Gordonia phage Sixama]
MKDSFIRFWHTHEFNPVRWVEQKLKKIGDSLWCNDRYHVVGSSTRYCERRKFHPGKHRRFSTTWDNVGRKK